MQKRKGKALVWLRNDLRTSYQQSLYLATKNHEQIIAYYSFDPAQYASTKWWFKKTEVFRAQFLIETITALQKDLADHNISLIIEQLSPHSGLPDWITKLGITDLTIKRNGP